MNKPNVITKIQYIECDNPRRVFYSSNSKDDYLGYIDKGVKLNNDIDYLDYTGNLEKVQESLIKMDYLIMILKD